MTKTAQLLALAEAATPGPWWREDEEDSSYSMVEAKGQTIVKLHAEDNCNFIAATNPETTKQLVELVRLQHEALRSCGEGGSRLSHHHAQWFNAEEVDEAIEAFNKWEGK